MAIANASTLPVYSDNVLPSMLVHLGVLDLKSAGSLPSCTFSGVAVNGVLLQAAPVTGTNALEVSVTEGPLVTFHDATVLRAGAVVACERFVHLSRTRFGRELTLPQIDAWLWSVAKDRPDYRSLPRFSLRNTVFF
jgi:hypothetical protein